MGRGNDMSYFILSGMKIRKRREEEGGKKANSVFSNFF